MFIIFKVTFGEIQFRFTTLSTRGVHLFAFSSFLFIPQHVHYYAYEEPGYFAGKFGDNDVLV